MDIADISKLVQEKLPRKIREKIHTVRVDAPEDFQRWDVLFGVKKRVFMHRPIYAITDGDYPIIYLFNSRYRKEISDIANECNIPYVEIQSTRVRFYGIQSINVLYNIPPYIEFANMNPYITRSTA